MRKNRTNKQEYQFNYANRKSSILEDDRRSHKQLSKIHRKNNKIQNQLKQCPPPPKKYDYQLNNNEIKLYLGGLPPLCQKKNIIKSLSILGKVGETQIFIDFRTKMCKGYATANIIPYTWLVEQAQHEGLRAIDIIESQKIKILGRDIYLEEHLSGEALIQKNTELYEKRVFVARIPRLVDDDLLKFTFQAFGKVQSAYQIVNTNGVPQTFGYVTFFDKHSTMKCLAAEGVLIKGKWVSVCPFKKGGKRGKPDSYNKAPKPNNFQNQLDPIQERNKKKKRKRKRKGKRSRELEKYKKKLVEEYGPPRKRYSLHLNTDQIKQNSANLVINTATKHTRQKHLIAKRKNQQQIYFANRDEAGRDEHRFSWREERRDRIRLRAQTNILSNVETQWIKPSMAGYSPRHFYHQEDNIKLN
jgi:hypothetical protein